MSIITANEPDILKSPRQKFMTVEEFLAIPDEENIERDSIRGEVKECGTTRRSHRHARTEARVSQQLQFE